MIVIREWRVRFNIVFVLYLIIEVSGLLSCY